jgi:hypothetical protein
VLQGRAALRSILDEGSADGPKIADADSHLAERLMELLTCVTASPRRVVIQLYSTMADVLSSCFWLGIGLRATPHEYEL